MRSFAGRLTRRIVLVLLIIMGLTAFWLFALGSIFVLEEETYRHEAMIQATAENINHVISDVCVAVNNQMPVGQGVGMVPCDANLPLGVMPGYRYTLQELTIERGTTIFLYTDGLNEAEDADHVQFGIQRVQDVAERLLEAGKNQPVTMVKRMAEEVHNFVGEAEQSDDLTMLAIKRSGEWREESGEC